MEPFPRARALAVKKMVGEKQMLLQLQLMRP
jgi:hypothetical protein